MMIIPETNSSRLRHPHHEQEFSTLDWWPVTARNTYRYRSVLQSRLKWEDLLLILISGRFGRFGLFAILAGVRLPVAIGEPSDGFGRFGIFATLVGVVLPVPAAISEQCSDGIHHVLKHHRLHKLPLFTDAAGVLAFEDISHLFLPAWIIRCLSHPSVSLCFSLLKPSEGVKFCFIDRC